MKKREFIKILEKKLKILNQDEINDITIEYEDIINGHIKSGMTEEEAVASFGNIDNLTKEILKTYKINVDFQNEKTSSEKIKQVADTTEDFIKVSAKKMAGFVDEVKTEMKLNDKEISIELIFEIIIKVIIFLIAIAILKWPFIIIEQIGNGILNVGINPVDVILTFSWKIVVNISYIITAFLIGYLFFLPYIKDTQKSGKVKKEKVANEVKEEQPEKTFSEEKNTSVSNEKIQKTSTTILKIFVFIAFIFPLIMANISLYIALSVLIYLMFKGLFLVGPTFITIGSILITTGFVQMFNNLFIQKPKKVAAGLIIGLVILIIGVLFTIDLALNLKLTSNTGNYDYKELSYKINLDDDDTINFSLAEYSEYKLTVNDKLTDGEVVYKVLYYEEFLTVSKNEYKNSNETNIEFTTSFDFEKTRTIIDESISKFKKNEIIDYSKYYKYIIVIEASEKTINEINIRKY